MDPPKYRAALPQLEGGLFLTDGGIETTLIFHRGLDLPMFAAFDLLKDEEGVDVLADYYRPYLELARDGGCGFVLESPTWRASPRWAAEIGYTAEELDSMNGKSIALMVRLRDEYENGSTPIVISGCVGPQDDGYNPAVKMSSAEAQAYHATQIETFVRSPVDMVTAITMTYVDEAVGITRAAQQAELPVAISFTLETDGRLPSKQGLCEAIQEVDEETNTGPVYYMINCAHPTHFDSILDDGPWRQRIRGLRANASRMSHAELDEATELDEGDPDDLATRYAGLRAKLPRLAVLGGCCGTDDRHVKAIRDVWLDGAST